MYTFLWYDNTVVDKKTINYNVVFTTYEQLLRFIDDFNVSRFSKTQELRIVQRELFECTVSRRRTADPVFFETAVAYKKTLSPGLSRSSKTCGASNETVSNFLREFFGKRLKRVMALLASRSPCLSSSYPGAKVYEDNPHSPHGLERRYTYVASRTWWKPMVRSSGLPVELEQCAGPRDRSRPQVADNGTSS